jgi:hypothetical protein
MAVHEGGGRRRRWLDSLSFKSGLVSVYIGGEKKKKVNEREGRERERKKESLCAYPNRGLKIRHLK